MGKDAGISLAELNTKSLKKKKKKENGNKKNVTNEERDKKFSLPYLMPFLGLASHLGYHFVFCCHVSLGLSILW